MDHAGDEEVQQMEVTLGDTETQTHAPRCMMWVDFADAAKELPGCVPRGGSGEEGWVRAKRGRVSTEDDRTECRPQPSQVEVGGHGILNLNLSPEKLDGGVDRRGRGGGKY